MVHMHYAVFKLIKLLLVLKLAGYASGPCLMGKLTIFSKCLFFATTNHSFSIFLVFTLHLVVARSELIGVCSDGCGSKSTISLTFIQEGSGRLQTLLHNLCYCLPVVSTTFASLIIYAIFLNSKLGVWGAKPPRR